MHSHGLFFMPFSLQASLLHLRLEDQRSQIAEECQTAGEEGNHNAIAEDSF